MSRYVFNAYCLDTTPGNLSSPFSPPQGWNGDDGEYIKWLRSKFKVDPELRQRLGIAVRAYNLQRPLQLSGNFDVVLLGIIQNYGKRK